MNPSFFFPKSMHCMSYLAIKFPIIFQKLLTGCSLGIRDRSILFLLHRILWVTFDSLWLFFIQTWSILQNNYSPVMLHLSSATGTFNENPDLSYQWYNLLKHPWFQFQALKCITQKRVQCPLFCVDFCINFNQHVN